MAYDWLAWEEHLDAADVDDEVDAGARGRVSVSSGVFRTSSQQVRVTAGYWSSDGKGIRRPGDWPSPLNQRSSGNIHHRSACLFGRFR